MQIFYDISNLLTTFQMSYIYHQVAILAYQILMYYQYTIREWNNYNIVTKYVDKLNNHLSRGSEEHNNDAKLQTVLQNVLKMVLQKSIKRLLMALLLFDQFFQSMEHPRMR